MRGVFARGLSAPAAWLLIVVLLAPAAFAVGTTNDAGLWAEFLAWVESGLSVPGGAANEDGFTAWLMSRFHIPGG
jgi:hypothetical protein